MHTDMPVQVFDAARVERARKIWWTVYMLDRELSSLMGLPIQLADENITAKYPMCETSDQGKALRLHTKLCKIIASVVGSKYINTAASFLTVYSGLRTRRSLRRQVPG
jgi:proline utilization trans-activator